MNASACCIRNRPDAKTHLGPRRLPDTVHRQLGQPNIDGPQPMRTDGGPDGAPARPVVPDLELLQGDFSHVGDSPDDEGRRCVRGVSLVRIGLDDHTLVDLRSVRLLVLGFKVRVELDVAVISSVCSYLL